MAPGESDPRPSPFERFEAFAKKLVNVPKKEVDEKQKEWERKQAKRPKRA